MCQSLTSTFNFREHPTTYRQNKIENKACKCHEIPEAVPESSHNELKTSHSSTFVLYTK